MYDSTGGPRHCARAAEPDRRRRSGQPRARPRGARRRGAAGRRPRRLLRAVPRRLPAGGSGAAARARARGGRGAARARARKRHRPRSGRHAALARRRRPPLQRRRARAGGRTELRFKRELPNYGVFDEKRVFTPGPLSVAGRRSAACAWACRSARTSGSPRPRSTSRARAPSCCSCPNGSPFEVEKSQQRLASRARRASPRPGWRWPTSTRSAGRTSSSSTAGRSSINPTASWRMRCRCGPKRSHAHALGAPRRRPALRGPGRVERGAAAPGGLPAMMLGLRDYVRKNGFPGRGPRHLGRHRFGAHRRGGRRRARRRARARRAAARRASPAAPAWTTRRNRRGCSA